MLNRYFDWAATSKISENALKEYINISENYYANASSLHFSGRECKDKLNKTREEFAELLKCNTNEVYFTSGGTESNNIIIQHLFSYPSETEIITTSVEHSSILECKNALNSHSISFKTVSCNGGLIDIDNLKQLLSDKTKIICLMAVNNVTGNILNLKEAISVIREYEKVNNRKIHIHSDAVQALCKIPFYPKDYDLDSASFSAHKFYGPKGTGILYNRNKNIVSLNKAGGQEMGLRGGTENLPGICASLTSLKDSMKTFKESYEHVYSINTYFRNCLRENNIPVLSLDLDSCSPYILNFSIPNLPSEVSLRVLSDNKFCVSSGSACNFNSKGKAEQTLKGFGIDNKLIKGSIRVSFSTYNSLSDVKDLFSVILKLWRGLV